jgi:hypothetical protein
MKSLEAIFMLVRSHFGDAASRSGHDPGSRDAAGATGAVALLGYRSPASLIAIGQKPFGSAIASVVPLALCAASILKCASLTKLGSHGV